MKMLRHMKYKRTPASGFKTSGISFDSYPCQFLKNGRLSNIQGLLSKLKAIAQQKWEKDPVKTQRKKERERERES